MLPANWLKSHFWKTEIMWRVQPHDGGICRPVYSVTTRWKAMQKMKDGPTTTGGHLSSYAGYGTLPGKGPSTTQQDEQFSSTAVVLLFFFVCCTTVTRSLFFAFNLITGDAAGVMRTRGQRYDGSVICKQTAFEFSSMGLGWVGAKNTSDRIWSPLLRLENSDVRQEDVQHQCHCGTSAGKEEGKRRRVGVFAGF